MEHKHKKALTFDQVIESSLNDGPFCLTSPHTLVPKHFFKQNWCKQNFALTIDSIDSKSPAFDWRLQL